MKTLITITKNIQSTLKRGLMFGALIGLGYTANAQCTASYTSIVDPADNGDVAFTNTTAGTGLIYNWSFGDGIYSTAINPGTHTYASSGTYTACLTIQDSINLLDSTMGCMNTFCSSITVINPAGGSTCTASFIAFDSVGYGYFSNISSGTGLTSTWSFGDGTSATGTGDITHLYASPGTYTVCLTISNFLGTCSDTYCDSVVIGGSTGTCNAYFVTADSAASTQFFDYATGTGSLTYSWDFGDGTTSTTVGDVAHTYATAGTYYACLTISDAGTCSNTYCTYVTIGAAPSCNATFAIAQDSINLFNYFIYNSYPLSATTTYLWDFGDGTTSTLQYPSHTYSVTSPVLICLTISDGAACSDTFCDSINPGHGASSVFTINVLPTATGIQEQANIVSTFENYPNPFSNTTTINYSINKDANVSVSIVDLLGNTISQLDNENKTSGTYSTVWDASSVAEGMYLLQLKVNNTVSTKKIIVNR
jgi:PKD repeat protein